MPLGDSITEGDTENYYDPAPGGYRNNLYADLTAAGIQVQFEGSSNSNPSPLLTANNETSHEGHSGYLIEGEPWASAPGGFLPGLYENINTWFSEVPVLPNIVLLMIGTNDFAYGVDVADAPARLGALLDEITADDPNGLIILSTLIYTAYPSLNAEIDTYNAAMYGLAATRPNVVVVNNTNILSYPNDYDDGLHPTSTGYNLLGDAFASEIEGVLAPEPASLWFAGIGLGLLHWRMRARRGRA
jgi:hypothetical protein